MQSESVLMKQINDKPLCDNQTHASSAHARFTDVNKRSYRKGIVKEALVCSLLTSMLAHRSKIPENPKEYYGVDKTSGLIANQVGSGEWPV